MKEKQILEQIHCLMLTYWRNLEHRITDKELLDKIKDAIRLAPVQQTTSASTPLTHVEGPLYKKDYGDYSDYYIKL